MPYMNLVSVLIILGLGYLWVTRGFFSALINLICVLAAGALALAFWEPTSMFLLKSLPSRGFLNFVQQSSWGLGLALPFAASLALLRAGLDKLLPSNVVVEPAVDYVGGGLCGAAAGIITAGFTVMSIGMLRMDTEFGGYRRIAPGTGNALVSQGKLWIPVDDIVAGLYGRASTGVFNNSTALAHYYPNLADVPEMLRSTEGGGKAMNILVPTGARVVRRYRVGAEGTTLQQLLGGDQWVSSQQTVVDFHGEQFPPTSRIEGYVIQFEANSKEKNGQVVIGHAQVRLLVHEQDDFGRTVARDIFPVAAVSLANASPRQYGRWRFDAPNLFVSSVGGATELLFGFEFPVPPNATPVALYIKGTRYDIDTQTGPLADNGASFTQYASVRDRDARIPNGGLTGSVIQYTQQEINELRNPTQTQTTNRVFGQRGGVLARNGIANYIIQRGTEQGLEVQGSRIIQGEAVFNANTLDGRGLDRALRINQFLNTTTTAIVLVDVSIGAENDLEIARERGANLSDRVQLVNDQNDRFDPIGYISVNMEGRDLVKIRYFPSDPITSLADLPTTSRTRPDQNLYLIYRISAPSQVVSFNVGDVVVNAFGGEPIDVQPQPDR
ncbi:MAG: hypothetical protein H6809_08160 [Phycisphaeraceae bacterium]|nr:hypothetical protein [Phycisphaeraceae bacterium]